MSERYRAQALPPLCHNAGTFGGFRKEFRLIDALVPLWRRIWPELTAAELASRTGDSPRMAEYHLSKTYNISGDALANLLASDAGLDHLEAIMSARGDAVPAWWKDFRRQVRLSQLSRSVAQISQDRERLEREFALKE